MDLSLCMCCGTNMVESGDKCNQCTRFIQDAKPQQDESSDSFVTAPSSSTGPVTEDESRRSFMTAPTPPIGPVTEHESHGSFITAPSPPICPVTEDEIRALLLKGKPVTPRKLITKFKSRLKSYEDKVAFAQLLRRISQIRVTNTARYVILKERDAKGTEMSIEEMFTYLTLCTDAGPRKVKSPLTVKNRILPKVASSSSRRGPAATGRVTTDEIRNVLLQRKKVTIQGLVAQFKSRLKCKEEKAAFADILRSISKIQKTNTTSYVVLRNSMN